MVEKPSITGKRRMTNYKMPREIALERFPDAEPVEGSMEIRNLPETTMSNIMAGRLSCHSPACYTRSASRRCLPPPYGRMKRPAFSRHYSVKANPFKRWDG